MGENHVQGIPAITRTAPGDDLGIRWRGSPMFTRRRVIQAGALAALEMACSRETRPAPPDAEPETLYNGIRLSTPWPPRYPDRSANVLAPPYLKRPPDVIPVDVGRQ